MTSTLDCFFLTDRNKFFTYNLGLESKLGHGDLGLESKSVHGDLGFESKLFKNEGGRKCLVEAFCKSTK